VNLNNQTSEHKTNGAAPMRETLLQKIRGLLAKTIENGCTEAEAVAALAKAQAMMDAYEISDEELALTKEEKAIVHKSPPAHDPHLIKRSLSYGVQQFTGTKTWYSTIRRGEDQRSICGLPADVDFAEWLIEALTRFVQAELVEFLATNSGWFVDGHERRKGMRSFVIGVTERITERLVELSKPQPTQSSNSRALVVTKQAAIDECMKLNDIKLGRGSCRAGASDNAAYAAGQAAGDRASFGRPISGNGATLRLGQRQ